MPKQKESRYAAKLREFGFEPYTPEQAAYVQHRFERRMTQSGRAPATLNRQQRRIVEKVLREPRFIVFNPPSIQLTDETGQGWRRVGEFDRRKLIDLGFKDSTAEAVVRVAALPPLPPEKTH